MTYILQEDRQTMSNFKGGLQNDDNHDRTRELILYERGREVDLSKLVLCLCHVRDNENTRKVQTVYEVSLGFSKLKMSFKSKELFMTTA